MGDRKMTRRTLFIRILTVTLLVSAALAPVLQAQSTGHGGGCGCGSHTDLPTVWQIESPPEFQNAATAEFERWNTYANVFAPQIGDGFAGQNGKNEIVSVTVAQASSAYGFNLDGDTFGITYFNPSSNFGAFNACPRPPGVLCGAFSETDVLINKEFSRGFTPDGPIDFNDDVGPANYGATAVHELGHTLGLHHNFDNVSTMNYYEDYAAQYISMADTATLRQQFPNNAKSNVIDLGTYPFFFDSTMTQYSATSPVTISPTSVAPGATITISNYTVENPGTVDLSNTRLRFYLSTDPTITPDDIVLGSLNFTSTFTTTSFFEKGPAGTSFTVPSGVSAGTYYVGAIIFFNSTQTDSITYNNSWVAPQQVTITGAPGTCTPSSANLCLLNNRFKVTLTVNDARVTGTGFANATPKGDYGFFDVPAATGTSDTPVVFVKLIDGRPVNNKYWVFYGGLTDVQYTFIVTDTQTGATKTYSKATGTYDGQADTSAFPGP